MDRSVGRPGTAFGPVKPVCLLISSKRWARYIYCGYHENIPGGIELAEVLRTATELLCELLEIGLVTIDASGLGL